jgi:hypothetical protein
VSEDVLGEDSLSCLELDPLGFPMVWVPELSAHVHWLPLTRIQFELFLARGGAEDLDVRWYTELCERQRRLPAREITADNFWRCLLTGVLPQEAKAVAEWLGPGFRLPRSSEWLELLRAADRPSPSVNWSELAPTLSPRCLALLQAFAALPLKGRSSERPPQYPDGRLPLTLADRMLLRGGLLEWVDTGSPEQPWGGMGEVHASLHRHISRLQDGEVRIPRRPTEERIDHFGFRLIRERSVTPDPTASSLPSAEGAP